LNQVKLTVGGPESVINQAPGYAASPAVGGPPVDDACRFPQDQSYDN